MIRTVKDQLGDVVTVPVFPSRIVSLVPSQTELLYDLGLGERVVGITKFCVHPKEWFKVKKRIGGTKQVNIEAVKAVSDLYCPVAGEIVDVNAALDDDPAVVNSDPYGEGWIVKIKVHDPAQVGALLDHGFELGHARRFHGRHLALFAVGFPRPLCFQRRAALPCMTAASACVFRGFAFALGLAM
jgi:glycine cleavage system H lipoate-binding protein